MKDNVSGNISFGDSLKKIASGLTREPYDVTEGYKNSIDYTCDALLDIYEHVGKPDVDRFVDAMAEDLLIYDIASDTKGAYDIVSTLSGYLESIKFDKYILEIVKKISERYNTIREEAFKNSDLEGCEKYISLNSKTRNKPFSYKEGAGLVFDEIKNLSNNPLPEGYNFADVIISKKDLLKMTEIVTMVSETR